MADNYTQFSFDIPLKTKEEQEWAKRAADFLTEYAWDGEKLDAPDLTNELVAVLPEDDWIGFKVEVYKSLSEQEASLWIYDDDSGTPSHVVPLVQEFLKRFNPTGFVTFSWATTCSKPRVNEFGGGAAFITATTDQWFSTVEWETFMIKKHQKDLKE